MTEQSKNEEEAWYIPLTRYKRLVGWYQVILATWRTWICWPSASCLCMRLLFLALWSQTKRPTQRFTEVWYPSEKSLEHRGRSVFPFSWYQPILGEKGNTATSSNYLVILKIPSNSRRVTVHDWNSSIIFQWMGKGLSAMIWGGKLGF